MICGIKMAQTKLGAKVGGALTSLVLSRVQIRVVYSMTSSRADKQSDPIVKSYFVGISPDKPVFARFCVNYRLSIVALLLTEVIRNASIWGCGQYPCLGEWGSQVVQIGTTCQQSGNPVCFFKQFFATINTLQMTDGHNIVTKARLLLQSAKKYRKLPEIPQYHLTLYNNVED